MGRPKKEQKRVRMSITLSVEAKITLKDKADVYGLNESQLVEKMIDFLSKNEEMFLQIMFSAKEKRKENDMQEKIEKRPTKKVEEKIEKEQVVNQPRQFIEMPKIVKPIVKEEDNDDKDGTEHKGSKTTVRAKIIWILF